MTVVAGPFFAAAGLLGAAGILKLAKPASTVEALSAARLFRDRVSPRWLGSDWVGRTLGAVELMIAAAALAFGGRLAAALVGASYLAFALFMARLLQVAGAGASCGCFGAEESPAARAHVAVNAAIAVTAMSAVAWPTAGIGGVLQHQPLAGVPFLALTAVCGWLLFAMLTVLPDLHAAMTEGA